MYLSRIILNQGSTVSRRALSSLFEMHRSIWKAFPDKDDGGTGRILFRVEPVNPKKPIVILVQSEIMPDWNKVLLGFLDSFEGPKEYNPQIQPGMELRFRLKANPTARRTLKNNNDKDSPITKRVGLLREEEQKDWLIRKAQLSGFTLIDYRIQSSGDYKCRKNGMELSHHFVDYEGIIKVTDLELFKVALKNGIGSGKGFGFGLLSIARK
jgi:CRISPR system Cascade subunit CasE